VILQVFFDIAAGTILTRTVRTVPTSYRSTAGSALTVAGTTGGSIGLLLESVSLTSRGRIRRRFCYLTIFWMLTPAIMWFLPETVGRELEEIIAGSECDLISRLRTIPFALLILMPRCLDAREVRASRSSRLMASNAHRRGRSCGYRAAARSWVDVS